jgi:hypothetical protein
MYRLRLQAGFHNVFYNALAQRYCSNCCLRCCCCCVTNRGTPGLLSTLGLLAAAGAAALVFAVPDDTPAFVAAQVVGAGALGAAAVAAFVGSNILGSLQKV